jgi:hypothetical protein
MGQVWNKIDTNLVSENIADWVSIFWVVWTLSSAPVNEVKFNVEVLDDAQPFLIAVNWSWSVDYNWNISIDWWADTNYSWVTSITPISIALSLWVHTVTITPVTDAAWWARCIGNWWAANYWNNDVTKIKFGLDYIYGYAFMENATTVWINLLYFAWYLCPSLTSMPTWFNLPDWISTVWNGFLANAWRICTSLDTIASWFNIPTWITTVWSDFLTSAWQSCSSLTSMSYWFNIPTGITTAWGDFLKYTWYDCTLLTSDTPNEPIDFPFDWNLTFGWTCSILPDTPLAWSSVLVKRS